LVASRGTDRIGLGSSRTEADKPTRLELAAGAGFAYTLIRADFSP
jgi:hypothetical protein